MSSSPNPFLTLFNVIVVLTLLAASVQASEHPSDARQRGAILFKEVGCTQCHAIRHRGAGKGPDLSGVGRRLNEIQIRTQIQDGGQQMPPFADVLERSEKDDLVAYLLSCRDKKAK